jgi:branched-chain amino acid transport system ATP-binding protein
VIEAPRQSAAAPSSASERREQPAAAADFLLAIDDLHVSYGTIPALRGISLRVRRGEIVAVVGPNGAGKSSLLNTIAGLVRPKRGHVRFADRQIDRLSIEDILRSGISLVPEGRHIFASMSVEENLRLGATIRSDADGVAKDIESLTQRFPILGKRWLQPAGRLSGGEQQQLAIARALLCRPALLMLDEPSLGLAPAIIDQVYDIVTDLRANGTTILVVEQNATRALKVANHTHILSGGALRLSGTSEELINNPQFDAAYFGLAPPNPAQQA